MTEAFYDLLKASLHGSIVILAVLLLRQLLKKAPRSIFCLLWLLAGLRLVLPFEIESNLSLQPHIPESELTIQAEQPVQVPDILIQNPDGQPLDVPDVPAQTPSLPEGSGDDLQTENLLYGEQDDIITEPISYGDIAAQIWLLGMGVMLAASAVSYWKLKRRVRMAYLTENGCFECPGLETAFVLGFLPPKIYLPAGLTEGEKKFIFDHENTHIARHDHWYKLLGYLVLSLHWFNPLVWVCYGALCRDIELACDEHVVRNMSLTERKAYSAALLSCGGHTARIAACPVAFGESNSKKRILNVLNYKRPTFWISLLAVIAVVFVAVCLMTNPGDRENAEKWMRQIEDTLYAIQSPDSYAIAENRSFSGTAAPMEQHTRSAYRYGENWLCIDKEAGSGEYLGYLELNGSSFTATSPDQSFAWQPEGLNPDLRFDPWLYSFDLKNSNARAISRHDVKDGYTLRLMVQESYADTWIDVSEYYVDFFFDREDQFLRAEQHMETGELSVTITMTCEDITGSAVRRTIAQYADSGMFGLLPGIWTGKTQLTIINSQSGETANQDLDVKLTLNADGSGTWEYARNGQRMDEMCESFTYTTEGEVIVLAYEQGREEKWHFQVTADTLYFGDRWDMTLYREESVSGSLSEDEYVARCREAMTTLKNSEELYLCTENLDNPMETTNVYAHAANGWLFQYRRPGWDYEAVNWLRLGNAQYIYGGDMDDDGVMTAPYYWQVEQNPESHDYQLPYPFDLDWENIELVYDGTAEANGMEAVTIRFPLYLDEFTFYFSDQGELWYFDVGDSSREPEATTTRFYVQFPYDGTVADYLTGLYEEAVANAGQKPEIPDDAFYEELFTRKADGAYTDRWIYDLFHAFYICPEEFVSHLAGREQAEQIITHMGYGLEYYAPYRCASVLNSLREDPRTDEQMLSLLYLHCICDDLECTDSSHDHSGINCTDEHCTNSTHHHDEHHH